MQNRFEQVERMLFLSTTFTAGLLTARIYVSMQGMYVFLLWNILLAVIPLLISRMLIRKRVITFGTVCLLVCWFVFFPNAPYLITDVLHFRERPPIPKWVDLMVVVSAAWNGLIIGIVSLLQVEEFLSRHLRKAAVHIIVSLSLLASAFGIYLGRFLRFNSWDIISNPRELAHELSSKFSHPQEHPRTWGFTLLFGILLLLTHYTVRKLTELKCVGL